MFAEILNANDGSDNAFDLLVIGATGNAALYERKLGTRADRIANLARCPVLIVR